MFEEQINALIAPIVNDHVYWVVLDEGFAFNRQSGQAVAVLQQVGGEVDRYVENEMPDTRHMRLQVSVWGSNMLNVVSAIRAIEKAIVESDFVSQVMGAYVTDYQEDLKIYGARQDFGFWYS